MVDVGSDRAPVNRDACVAEPTAPLVSVVVPTYNRARLVPRAIRSVLMQGYPEVELIVVDDGSTDDTLEVLRGLADARIRCIRFPENRGIGAGREAGVRAAKGEFIAFVDADDTWLPGKLESQLRVFARYENLELLCGNYWNVNHVTGEKDWGYTQTARSLKSMECRRLEDGLWQVLGGLPTALLDGNFFGTSTVMFRRRILERTGGFNTALSGPEDFEFWWRAAVRGVCVAFLDQPLAERNKDAGSITAEMIRFVPRYVSALEVCEETAVREGRADLLVPLRQARYRALRELIWAQAQRGRRSDVLRRFVASLRYGSSAMAWLYLLAGIAGPNAIGASRKAWRAVRRCPLLRRGPEQDNAE